MHIALSNGASLGVVKILLGNDYTDNNMVNTPNKIGLCPLIIALISIDFILIRNSDERLNLSSHLACSMCVQL